jgi:hypothetical protein
LIIIIGVIAFFLRRRKRVDQSSITQGPYTNELSGGMKQPAEARTLPVEEWTQSHELPSRDQPAWGLPGVPRTYRAI